jgi:hypothetical protein
VAVEYLVLVGDSRAARWAGGDLTFPRPPGFQRNLLVAEFDTRAAGNRPNSRAVELGDNGRRRKRLAPPAESAGDREADQSSDHDQYDDHEKDEFPDTRQEASGFEFGGKHASLSHREQHSLMVGVLAPPRFP